MNNYEVMFVLEAALDDAKKQEVIETVKGIIAAEGELGNVNVWGNRRLAYPINKKNEGYYVVADFKSNPQMPKELDRRLRISDSIIRHIIINKDEK